MKPWRLEQVIIIGLGVFLKNRKLGTAVTAMDFFSFLSY
jgi:hypothetical protein